MALFAVKRQGGHDTMLVVEAATAEAADGWLVFRGQPVARTHAPRGPAGRKTGALRQDRGVEVGEVDSPPRSPRDALRARRPVASAGSPEVDGTSGRVPRESVY